MNDYSNRIFQNPDDDITGKSVVNDIQNSAPSVDTPLRPWPYNLSDYLEGFIGRRVQIHYINPNRRECKKRGWLVVTGSNFIGIQSDISDNLFIIEMRFVRSIYIIDCNSNPY